MNIRPHARRQIGGLWLALAVFLGLSASLPAATLLKYNFEGTNTWTGMTGYFQTAGGSGTATPTVTTVGTVNGYGTAGITDVNNVASNGIKLLVNSQSATGTWTAGVNSGTLTPLTANSLTNLGLITLSFNLWSSNANPILVRVESYDTNSGLRTGGLKTLIYPATPNFYQRFALDLSTMTADGTGTFVPNNSNVRIYFEIGNTIGGDGWPNAAALELHIDNINYSTPKYYVKPSSPGSDSNDGLTETTPWKSISKAVGAAGAGDNIIVLMGSETDQFVATGTNGQASFAKPGTPDAWIVLKNYPGQRPVLRSSSWAVINIGRGSNGSRYTARDVPSYIEVRGLTVRGYSSIDTNGDRQIASQYLAKVGLPVAESNSNGISVDGRYTDYYVHDFRFADNIVEYTTGGGISAIRADRVAIENNVVRYVTWWSIYGGSGMSYLCSIDTEANSDTRMLVQGNQCYGNEGMIPWRSANQFSDGNGIIVDTNQITKSSYNFSSAPDYAGRTLVQNNLSYNNGGSGIHSFQSSHVDIIHNTAYRNSASPRLQYSQIFAGYSKDVRMVNNILVAPNNPTGSSSFNEPITSNSSNTSGTIYYQNNVFYGEGNNQSIPTNSNFTNNTTTDPLFLSASIDPATNDFHLRSTSPALNNGLNIGYRSALDYAARPRLTTNTTPDRGAYQSQASDAKAPVFTPQPGNYTTAQSVSLVSDTSSAKIVYTTNGTVPTVDASGNVTNGTAYSAAIPVSAATTFKAIAWKSGLTTSYISNAVYTLNTTVVAIPTPTFDVWPLTDDGTQSVSVICATPGALVRYTTDGTTPTASSGTIATNTPVKVTAGSIVKAIAYKSGRGDSSVLTGNFVVRPRLGNLTEGTTADTLGASKMRFVRFHPGSDLTITKIYAKVGAITGSYRAAVYSDTSGVPGTLLRASSAAVTNPAAGWQAFSLSALALDDADSDGNSLYYWLAVWSNDAAASVYTTTTGGTVREATSTFSSTWPTTAPTTTANANAAYSYSIFATTNYRPVVSAGANQTLAASATTASLSGSTTDNSTPAVPLGSGVVTTAWSKVSGPGTVTFANAAALATTATFSQAGTYVLRLTGQDSVFTPFGSVTSDVTITLPGASSGIATSTSVTSNTAMGTLGTPIILTASVSGTSGTPAGSVNFLDGTTSLGAGTLDGTGTASLTTSALSVGTHSITAVYAGNASYATSTSGALPLTVYLLDGTTRLLAVNAAGPAISGSGFAADTGFTGGAATSTTATIDRTGLTYPAPAAVYQTERYGTFSYTVSGLTPAAAYLVRLHFCENWWGVGTRVNQTSGQRPINVSINGAQRLSSFDIWAAAGASNKAVIREFSVAADNSGVITVNFAGITGSPDPNALVDGLEVYTVTSFNAWRVSYFTPAQLDDASLTGPLADFDKDGISNLLEYALGTDPLNANAMGLPTLAFDGDGHLTLTFLRARNDVTYIVEGSSNLVTWTTIASNPGSVGQSVTATDNAPLDAPARFLRLRVTY